MEPSIWVALINFFKKEIHSTYRTQSVSGFGLGIGLGYINYFGFIPEPSLVHTWIGIWLWIKAIFWALSMSVATALGAKLVDRYWERHKKRSQSNHKKRNRA